MTESASNQISDLDGLRASTRATLTIVETASILGVDPRTCSRAISDGSVPSLKVGRRILIPRIPLLHLLTGERDAA